jgi:high-affinity Fe2+/Pb2+ permease
MKTGAMLVAFLILWTAAAAALDTCEYIASLWIAVAYGHVNTVLFWALRRQRDLL